MMESRRPESALATTLAAFALTGLLATSAPQAQAQQESCDQCKYLRCLKNTVKRKQALVEVYQGLRNFWARRTTDEHGAPLMVKDLSRLAEPERSRIYIGLLQQLKEYAQMEERRTSAVSGAEGCGYTDAESSAETDSFAFCTTRGLGAAKAAQPCKELADLIEAHEGRHVAACKARQKPDSGYWPYSVKDKDGRVLETKFFPPKMITPAGLAAEEVAAYQSEIGSLKKLVEKLEKKCRKVSFKGVTLDCVMGSGQEKLRTGQRLEGHACGDPVTATWTIKQTHFMEARGLPPMPENTDEFTSDCVAVGSDIEKHYADVYRRAGPNGGGWFCVYREKPKPQITIRSFRLGMCEGPTEQKVTVDAIIGERCEEADDAPMPTPNLPVS